MKTQRITKRPRREKLVVGKAYCISRSGPTKRRGRKRYRTLIISCYPTKAEAQKAAAKLRREGVKPVRVWPYL